MEFQGLMSGSIELHLLCHVTLLCYQVDPKAISKAKSKVKNIFHVIVATPNTSLMWQPLTHSKQCYSSNTLPFMQVSSCVVSASSLSIRRSHLMERDSGSVQGGMPQRE